MKLTKFSIGFSTSLLLSLGVSNQVKAHGLHSHTSEESIIGNLTETVEFPPINFPKVTSPPRGEVFDFPDVTPNPDPLSVLFAEGEQISFLKTTENTNGEFTLLDILIPPGGGPPPHIHHNVGEWLYFISEGFTLYISDETYSQGEIPGINAPKANFFAVNAKPGTLFYTPPNHIHAHTNTGTMLARELVVAHNDLDKWFQLGGIPITDPSNLPALDFSKLNDAISVAPDFGLTISSYFGEFIDTVDPNFPDELIKNNRAEELTILLSKNTKSVPEYSSAWGVLAFGAFCAISIPKRKQK